jgi:hypothetical protein
MAIKNTTANNSNLIKVLSINDMSYQPQIKDLTFKIPKKLLNNKNNSIINSSSLNELENNSKITLLQTLNNSLINRDHDTFLFCIKQKDDTLIDYTVKQMDSTIIQLFLEKVIDLFQSNSLYSKNILPWLKKIFKYHKFHILSMDNKTIENLNLIKNYIINYTKYYDKFSILKEKLSLIHKEKGDKININNSNNNIENNINGPLLTYYESDDEQEIKEEEEKMKKMKNAGFEEFDNEEEEIDEAMENNDNEINEEEDENFLDIDEEEENKINHINKKNKNNEDEMEEEEDDDNI